MRTNQTLDEARKYLLYVSDALNAVAKAYSTDRQDRNVLEKYAAELFEYSNHVEQLKQNITAKEEENKKRNILADLEETYEIKKRTSAKTKDNVRIIKARLKEAEESKNKIDIEEFKKRLEYYAKQNLIAQQNELIAKHDMEQGA